MNCQECQDVKLKASNSIFPCKCCEEWFCSDSCVIGHMKQSHLDKIVKKEGFNPFNSEFVKEGLVVKDVYDDPYFYFENLERVNKSETLGAGAFGEVYLVKHKKDGRLYAVKQLDKSRIAEIGIKEEIIHREIDCHLGLIHQNIARLYSFHEDELAYYLIMEYVNGGTLFNLIQKSSGMKEEKAFQLFIQVSASIQYLHHYNMIHRDIKPENVLVDKEGNVKICDFGWTVEISDKGRSTFCGTYEYMAPEMVKEMPYDQHIDVWSLGVLLYELTHGYSPFRVTI